MSYEIEYARYRTTRLIQGWVEVELKDLCMSSSKAWLLENVGPQMPSESWDEDPGDATWEFWGDGLLVKGTISALMIKLSIPSECFY